MANLKMKRRGFFWIGIAMLVFLAASYFIKFPIDNGANYITYDSVLGIIIFHNPFILGLYILIGIVLIANGLKKK